MVKGGRMKKSMKVALAVAGTLLASNASAAKYVAGDLAKSYMTYTTVDQVNTSRTSGYSGVGSLFISTVSTATTGLGGLCTGSLIGGGTVLTAAHCLSTDADDPITSIAFYLPSFGDRRAAETQIFSASAFAIHPDYAVTGLAGGNDVAAFTITGDTTGYEKYGLFTGDPFQQYTEVGAGTVGGPRGTNVGVTSDYRKRVGSNIYEYYGSDIFSDSSEGVVLYDFDDGTAAHDVFGRNGGYVQRGVLGESAASPGDSGGPEFIDGKIVSVTSFGITGGIFDEYCGGNSTDPYNNTGSTAVTTNLANCTNSSVGEIGGNTLVSYNRNFIDGYLNGTVATLAPVPEPATWAMMLTGFGIIGFAMRRRKSAKTIVGYA
jgi:hypothetical protein